MRLQLRVLVWLAGSVLLSASVAHASPVFELVGDTTSSGGLQARTVPGGAASAYFNPALLVEVPATLSFGITLLSTQIGVSLAGRPSTEFAVPEGIQSAGHADGKRFELYPIATKLLQKGRLMSAGKPALLARPRQAADSGHQTQAYGALGIVVKLFDERLAVGFHGLIPLGDFTRLRAFYSDEREQYFSNSLHPELYADRMTAMSIAFGAGVRVTDALSLGIGSTLSITTVPIAQAFVADTGNLANILLDMDAPVKVSLSPHFGASYVFNKRLRFSATAHAPERISVDTAFTFLLASGIQQASKMSFVQNYKPWQVGLGGSYDLIQDSATTLNLSLALLYSTWSSYQDRHAEQPSGAYAWSDTLAPTLGARLQLGRVSTFIDLTYQPTPVPAQTGRTNYVDNDRLGSHIGAEYAWSLWGNPLRVGMQLQVHRLVPRYQNKIPTPTTPDGVNHTPALVRDEVPDDSQVGGEPLKTASGLQTNNPGWPGFGSEGWLLGASLYLAVAI